MTKCIQCHGVGKAICPGCEGSGRKMSICPTCTKGYVPDPRSIDDEPTILCPDCHGNWQLEDNGPCETCNGSGKVECDFCKGVGELDVDALCLPLINVAKESIRTEKLTREMVAIIKDAADNGNGMAAYVTGRLYGCYGGLKIGGKVIVPEDVDKMLAYLRIAAEAGNIFAQGYYGNELRVGVSDSSEHEDGDDAAGYPWIIKAAENGDVLSLHRLSYDYLGGSNFLQIDLGKAQACFRSILAAKDTYAWNDEWIERAKGYVEFLPEIIKGNADAMRQLGEWLKEREGAWEWSWGIGEAETESSYWQKKANDTNKTDEVDEQEKGALPEFIKPDLDNAVAGKAATESSGKKNISASTTTKKRWKFVVLGLLLGFFGVHLAYARRWLLFLLLWAGFITGNVVSDTKTGDDKPTTEIAMQQVDPSGKSTKTSTNTISNIGFGVWVLLWIGGTLFIKKDGKGRRM